MDRELFGRLFITCQTRKGDLKEFFKYENQPFPLSISDFNGELQDASKMKHDLLPVLEKLSVSTPL